MRPSRLRRWATLTLGFCSVVAVFGSFLWQLYGPRPSLPGADAPASWRSRQQLQWARAWCIAGLAGLERELGEQSAALLDGSACSAAQAQARLDHTLPRLSARLADTASFCRQLDEPLLQQALVGIQAQDPGFLDDLRQRMRQRRDQAQLLHRARERLGWRG